MIAVICVALLLSGQQSSMPVQAPAAAGPARDIRTGSVPETKGTAVLKGHVKTADGRLLRRAQIDVRGSALPNGRTASTGLEGEYEIHELPPGDYLAVALETMQPWQAADPEFLATLKDGASRVTVREGQPLQLTLPLLHRR